MPNTLKSITATSHATPGTESTIYTVPAATTVIVTDLRVANTTAGVVEYSLKASGVFIGKDLSLPTGATDLHLAGSTIILETGETLTVSCDTASGVDIIASIVERT